MTPSGEALFPSASGRKCEFPSVPMSCRSPLWQFPPKAALWQHVVRVLPATSGPSRKYPEAAIEAFGVYANALRFDVLLFTIYLILYKNGSRAPKTQA